MRRFGYDSRGNLAIIVSAYARENTTYKTFYKNTYKYGRLVQQRIRDGSSGASSSIRQYQYKYKYKKVSVPKKYVAQVKRQQWALLNPNASFVFPPFF
ncbi:MAG TPA: hypothetical protein DCP91_12920 [Eggerthellaceae bacterium]|nr:hypothetical protein [Eggerthellaceae bacterium]